MMAGKLGLNAFLGETDDALVSELLRVLQLVETDMTLFYRNLADVKCRINSDGDALIAPLMDAYYQPEQLTDDRKIPIVNWLRAYTQRVADDGTDDEVRRKRMNRTNPKYVLRNYLAQLAIDTAEQGDGAMVMELLEILRRPYDEQPGKESFAEKRPDWARHRPGCSMLSCSS